MVGREKEQTKRSLREGITTIDILGVLVVHRVNKTKHRSVGVLGINSRR